MGVSVEREGGDLEEESEWEFGEKSLNIFLKVRSY